MNLYEQQIKNAQQRTEAKVEPQVQLPPANQVNTNPQAQSQSTTGPMSIVDLGVGMVGHIFGEFEKAIGVSGIVEHVINPVAREELKRIASNYSTGIGILDKLLSANKDRLIK